MSTAVDPLLTVSLLEAVRHLDQPEQDLDAEYVQELRNKRLGLSDTVYAQIKRYHEAVRRGTPVPRDEAIAIVRLLARRPDADAVFRDAGRRLARASFDTLPGFTRTLLLALPGIFVRSVALRHLRRLAMRYVGGRVVRVGGHVVLTIPDALAIGEPPADAGAVLYESLLREYAALFVGASGAVERIAPNATNTHQWRTEWRAAPTGERRAMRAATAQS